MNKYEVILYWSNEDKSFVAEVPELPGCMVHGDSQESALKNINQAIELWIETAKEFGDSIPEPKAGDWCLPDGQNPSNVSVLRGERARRGCAV